MIAYVQIHSVGQALCALVMAGVIAAICIALIRKGKL
jgi:hypothetical protein